MEKARIMKEDKEFNTHCTFKPKLVTNDYFEEHQNENQYLTTGLNELNEFTSM